MDPNSVVLVVLIAGLALAGYMAGRGSGHGAKSLALMELNAMARTAKLETDHVYERYRIATVRMDWVALPVEAKKEYTRLWGKPAWAHPSRAMVDVLDGVATVRGR